MASTKDEALSLPPDAWDIPIGGRVLIKSMVPGNSIKLFGTVVDHVVYHPPTGTFVSLIELTKAHGSIPLYRVRMDFPVLNVDTWMLYRSEIEPTVTWVLYRPEIEPTVSQRIADTTHQGGDDLQCS